ncbi:Hypothetical predicted protein [Olea europaea subsp. europaea]|uniref:Uncharacterized protein n=1 Tax=Olea europaea subsp. europaea TaxID=158383 RepID=A0A8S0V4S3_OLEEU|nr:Hypothetical predicted protein [Olea europaea subsp. europaea]
MTGFCVGFIKQKKNSFQISNKGSVQVLGTRNDQYGILSGCFGIFGKCSAPTVSVLLASSHPQQSPNSSTLLAGK